MKLYHGDCLVEMGKIDDNSVDTIITDPPYGLSFMGKKWDYDVPTVEQWKECLRVAKPGAILLSFSGTRTYHRMVVNIEDAGWEIRDCIFWCYGSGFPKSLSISKQLDKEEKNKWLKIIKAIDKIDVSCIIEEWKKYSNTVNCAEIESRKNQTGVGTVIEKKDSVVVNVVRKTNQEKLKLSAIVAELKFHEAKAMSGQCQIIAQENVEASIKQSQENAKSVEKRLQGQKANADITTFIAQFNVKELRKEQTMDKIKAVEALRTWLGKSKSSSREDTNALCAALTDDLNLIILNQSKTFQSLGTNLQMDCVSAINVIITESTAEHLISSMVDILKSKAIDKMQGAERENKSEFSGVSIDRDNTKNINRYKKCTECGKLLFSQDPCICDWRKSKGNTPEAKLWDGWGSSLKPAVEPICVAMKPLDGTFAQNALKWGVAGLWIDGGRVGTETMVNRPAGNKSGGNSLNMSVAGMPQDAECTTSQGRFPANLILSWPEDEYELKDGVTPEQLHNLAEWLNENT